MREQGLQQVNVWVPCESAHDVRAVACLLRCRAGRPIVAEMPEEPKRHAEQLHAAALLRWPAEQTESSALVDGRALAQLRSMLVHGVAWMRARLGAAVRTGPS